MNPINIPRVIGGGLLAGLVMIVIGTVGNRVIMAGAWQQVLESGTLPLPQRWVGLVGCVPDLVFGEAESEWRRLNDANASVEQLALAVRRIVDLLVRQGV